MIPEQLSLIKISILIASLALLQLTGANPQDLRTQSSQNNDTQTSGRPLAEVATNDRAEAKSTRAGRMLDLDRLAGEVGRASSLGGGGRQSRRLAATENVEERAKKSGKGGKKMAIQGFIPIVSLEGGGKQLESLAEHFASDSTANDQADDNEEKEQQAASEQQQASHLREHLASNFGAQTSMGHASFAVPNQQQFSAQNQWHQVQPVDQHQESARARKLLAGTLFSGHRQGLRPLAGGSLVSNFIQHPAPSIAQQQQQLNGPMNAPAGMAMNPLLSGQNYLLAQASQQQQQQPLVALGLEQSLGDQCICVPFFQCKNGFLSESQLSKSQLSQLSMAAEMVQVPRSLDQQRQAQQQQQFPSQPSDQQMVNDIYEQLRKNIESQNLERELQQEQQQVQQFQRSLINERLAKSTNSSSPEGEERSLLNSFAANMNRRQASSGRQCGIMRACCRIPAHLLLSAAGQQQPARAQQQQQQFQQAHSARFVQRQQPQYQLISPHRSQQVPQHLVQPPVHQQSQPVAGADQLGDYLGGAQQQQAFQVAPAPAPAASEQAMVPQRLGQQQQLSQFMSGRCGLRQTLGISGRVQNSQAQAQGEQTNSEFGEFPAHAAILKRISPGDSLFVCSAVLLSSQWLATAAHCVKKARADELKVRLGEWDVSRDDEFYPHVESNVREILLHPDFQASSLINDLALIRLEQAVGLGEQMPHISPACLAQPEEQFAGQRCWVAGWGKDAFGHTGTFQSTLRKVDLPVVAHQDCEQALKYQTKLGKYFRLHQNNICAGGERGKDACEGDGGAGLYCVDPASGLSKAVGLVSWGVGCGQRGVPGVYVSLAQYSSWIEQVVASSGEENVYSYTDQLGGRQQQQQQQAADAFKGIISERSNERSNETTASPAPTTTASLPAQLLGGANRTEAAEN